MTVLALSVWWVVGWVIGVVVVALVAALVIVCTLTARRIAAQARDVTVALDGTQANTAPLFDVVATNQAIDRVTRGLRRAREGHG